MSEKADLRLLAISGIAYGLNIEASPPPRRRSFEFKNNDIQEESFQRIFNNL